MNPVRLNCATIKNSTIECVKVVAGWYKLDLLKRNLMR